MVYTLHRYIFKDLIKTFLTSTLVLSTVLGLGMMLGPMRQMGIDPVKVPELFLCTLPITLTMVLPIAALLSATLNYGRLASDNEVMACRASGISILTLVYPALILAMFVGASTLLLAFQIVPYFTHHFETILQQDSKQMVFRSIQKTGNLNSFGSGLKNLKISADNVLPQQNLLENVALISLNDKQRVESVFTAQQVYVSFEENDFGEKEVVLQAKNGVHAGATSLEAFGTFEISRVMPSMWKDDIKFKRLSEMQAIRRDISLFRPIREQYINTKSQMKIEYFYQWAHEQLQNPAHAFDLYYGKDRIKIRATQCEMVMGQVVEEMTKKGRLKKVIPPVRKAKVTGPKDGFVIVEHYLGGQPDKWHKIYKAKSLTFEIKLDGFVPDTISEIALQEVEFSQRSGEASFLDETTILGWYGYPDIVAKAFESSTLNELVSASTVAPLNSISQYLEKKLLGPLKEKSNGLARDIQVELNARLAFGVSCVVMVLFGAALGISMPNGASLSAFGIGFLPAIVCMTTISTGKHMAEDNMFTGLLFLWSGIGIMVLANLKIYGNLLKR